MSDSAQDHEQCWLLLPWLANGRLSAAERAPVEEHAQRCPACAGELALQRLMCRALAEPDRVTYAPGPSLRKLMARIEGRAELRPAREARAARIRAASPALAAWRPPGLAWAASVLAVIGLAAATAATYHWSKPVYATLTAPAQSHAAVLHLAFERSLPAGEAEELLRAAGARVVEGPDATGIFGVVPVTPGAAEGRSLRALALRLQSDAHVRWVEPLAGADAPADTAQGSAAREP
jgi:anti-sigma factor RsiW